MKVLVTGAAGCLGRAVCARLLARGHEVRGVDLAGPSGGSFAGAWARGDLFELDLAGLCAGCDAVVHLAALVHRPDLSDPAEYLRVNVEGTRRMLEAARAAGIAPARFVFSSTVGVYPRDHGLHADETTPCAPRTPYGVSKLEAERRVLEHGGVVLRFPLLYGSGDRGRMAALIGAIARGRFVLPGPCREPRSLVASANAAEGVALSLERAVGGGVYLVTDDDDVPVRRLVEGIVAALPGRAMPPELPLALLWPAALLGSALAAARLHTPLTVDALLKLTTRLTFSCALARRDLGYRPVITLESGIREEVGEVVRGGARRT